MILRLKGYKIHAQRTRTPFGEIDIIATKRDILAIVEVKRRANMQLAHDALSATNIRRIEQAVDYLLAKETWTRDKDIRFDAFFVFPGGRFQHLTDAWRSY
jgi:putative endonuclease